MKFLYSFPSHTSTITQSDDLYRRTAVIDPLFAELEDGDETFKPIGLISEESAHWALGRSNQNNCLNIHVSGGIYDVGQTLRPSPRQARFFTPVYALYEGNKIRGDTWTEIITDPYAEAVWIDGNKMERTVTFNSPHRGERATYFQRLGYFWVRSGPYWLRLTSYTPIWVFSDGTTSVDGSSETIGLDTPRYYLSDNRGLPGRSSSSTTRVPNSAKVGYTMNVLGKSFQVTYVPPESEIKKYVSAPSTSPQKFISCKARIHPPLMVDGSYDVRFPYGRKYDLDSAFAQSLDQVDFTTSNGIAYALDAKDIVSSAKSDLESLRSLAKGAPGKLKIAASLFLSFHYGWKLMASDTMEFANVLDEYSKTSSRRVHCSTSVICDYNSRGGLTLVSGIAHRNVYYDPYAQIASKTLRLAEAMDAVPDISNVWDMIPFSFVVDWFTNIGDLAAGIDAFYTLTQQHKVLGTIDSQKEVYEYRKDGLPGKYEYVIYDRKCHKDWYPIPDFSFQLKNPITNLTHWCEAGALVVATRP